MTVFNAEEVKKCLEDVVGEDKMHALWLLEWAIDKRTFDLEEHDNKIRVEEHEKTIDECKQILKTCHMIRTMEDDFVSKVEIPFYKKLWKKFDELKGNEE